MALPLPWAWNIDRTTCSRYRACQITGGRKPPPASLALHALIAREIYSVPGDPVAPAKRHLCRSVYAVLRLANPTPSRGPSFRIACRTSRRSSRILLIPRKLPRGAGAGRESGQDRMGVAPVRLALRDLELIIELHQRTLALVRFFASKEL
jgi:hypothetical protein